MGKYYKKLVGENIYLSPVSIEDAEKFTEWMSDMNVTDYTGRTWCVQNLKNERDWVEDVLAKGDYVLTIVTLAEDKAIGNISLMKVDHVNRTATLGIMIGEEDARNKGYGTEAIKLLLDYAFNYLNLNNVDLTCLAANARAIRCYEKVGFKEFGRRRLAKFVNGKYYDEVHMDVLSEEFKESYIKNKNVK